jgi:nucleotide-binding universal stress UspA family protein
MTFRPKHILVPLAVAAGDDRAISDHLIDVAIDLARTGGAKLSLTWVEPNTPPTMPLDIGLMPTSAVEAMIAVRDANRDAAKKMLHEYAAKAHAAGVDASARIADATSGIGETIAQLASEIGAELVVVSSHGRRGMRRLLLGSVAERTAHLSSVPVLIVRAPAH